MSIIAETCQGKIAGITEENVHIFKGVPYAKPPVGELRWMPPQPPEPWTDVRDALTCKSAPQPATPPGLDIISLGMGPQDEDCLYLNIYTPALDNAKRPVFFWIHGGAFIIGSGDQTLYDGKTLVQRGDIVVVSINYRLGSLGFLNLNEVTGGRIPASGNEGLLDQVAALHWVKENIANFGGDPDNITIAGESAGGMSVGALLGLPAAKGLFQRAIPQSGASNTALTQSQAVQVAEMTLQAIDISARDIDKLRNVDAQTWMKAQTKASAAIASAGISTMPYQPVIDGNVLPTRPIEAVAAGAVAGMPLLIGTTAQEWNLFAGMDPELMTLSEKRLQQRIANVVSEEYAASMLTAYREARQARNEPHDPARLFLAFQTDHVFRIPALMLAEAQSGQGGTIYNYLFTWQSPAMGGLLGACHALELGFEFGTYNIKGMEAFHGSGPAADKVAQNIQDSWLAFIRDGNPSCQSSGEWHTYTADNRNTVMINETCELQKNYNEEERAAWGAIPWETVITL